MFADPGEFTAMQTAFVQLGMKLTWEFPLSLGGLQATGGPGLEHSLNRAAGAAVPLSGDLAGANLPLSVHTELLTQLTAFTLTDAAVQQVLALLFVSLTVVGVAVLLLAARIYAARRAVELEMVRSRGASLRQLTALMLRASLLTTVPAALAGGGLALLVTPGPGASLGWWLGGLTTLAALGDLPLIAAWQYRKPAPAPNQARRARWPHRRVVAEVAACAAAGGGLLVLHDQGAPAPGSVNLYIAAAPALVAVLAVIVVGRLYPLIVGGLLRLFARRAGASVFLALTRAARAALASAAPAFALVLALTLASFAGMVRDAVARGEVAASWQVTGGDAVIDAIGTPDVVTPAVQRAVAAVPGVRGTALAWLTSWQLTDNQIVTVIAVEPAGYAAYTASVPYPPAPLAGLGSSGGITTVLASPSAAAAIGPGPGGLTSGSGVGPLQVRVAATVASTPAAIDGGMFVIMALQRITGERPAHPQPAADHRDRHQPFRPGRRGEQGPAGDGDPVPFRGARPAGQFAPAGLRRGDHAAVAGRGGRVRPGHPAAGAGPGVGGAGSDPGPADHHGPGNREPGPARPRGGAAGRAGRRGRRAGLRGSAAHADRAGAQPGGVHRFRDPGAARARPGRPGHPGRRAGAAVRGRGGGADTPAALPGRDRPAADRRLTHSGRRITGRSGLRRATTPNPCRAKADARPGNRLPVCPGTAVSTG